MILFHCVGIHSLYPFVSPPEGKPQLSPQDSTTTLQVGVQSHDLVCAAMDVSEAVLNFTWHVNGVLLESHPKLTVLAGSGDRSSRLHITNITYGEAANYTCTVSNMAGTVQQTTSIEVRGRLSTLTPPPPPPPSPFIYLHIGACKQLVV